MNRILIFLSLLFVAVGPAAAAAGDCSLLLDVSGSMKGFRNSDPRGDDFGAMLNEFQTLCPAGYVFGDPDPMRPGAKRDAGAGPYLVRMQGQFGSQLYNNATTHLGRAVARWGQLTGTEGEAIIVTDNVADTRDIESMAEQSIFYREITDPAVTELAVIASRFYFNGLVYEPGNDSVHNLYAGPRGVAIYVLRKGPGSGTDSLLAQVYRIVQRHAIRADEIPIRPFIRYSEPRGSFNNVTSNDASVGAHLVRGGDGIPTLVVDNHHLDEPVELRIALTFDANAAWRVKTRVHASVSPTEQPLASELTAFDIPARIEPSEDLTIGGGGRPERTIVIPIEKVDYKATAGLGPITQRLLMRGATVSTSGEILVTVRFETIELSPPIREDWDYDGGLAALGAADAAVQSKIYQLQTVVSSLLTRSIVKEKPYRVRFKSDAILPQWPIYVLSGFVLLFMAGGAFFVIMVGRRRDFELVDDAMDVRRASLALGDTLVIQSCDGAAKVKLRRLVVCFLATSPIAIERGRILWGDAGGSVQLRVGGGLQPFLYRFSKAFNRQLGARSSRRSSADDIWASESPAAGTKAPLFGETYRFRIRALTPLMAQRNRKRRSSDEVL